MKVGDEIQIKVSLTGPDLKEEVIWLRIKEEEAPKEKVKEEEDSLDNIGLPALQKIKKEDWENAEASSGISMNYDTVMTPIGSGDTLEKIIINLDSNVYLKYRAKLKTEDQLQVAEKRYIASIYFHTLFLYMITKKRNYKLSAPKNSQEEDVTIDEYLRDIFDSYYSDFLLNFGMEQLMNTLSE